MRSRQTPPRSSLACSAPMVTISPTREFQRAHHRTNVVAVALPHVPIQVHRRAGQPVYFETVAHIVPETA